MVDIPATYTIGQEFILAAVHRALPERSLAEICHLVSSVSASTVVVGVYWLAFAWCGSPWVALLAALLYTLTPASYRTVGFLCIREDASLPLFALHIGALAMSWRRRSLYWALISGCTAALAWATWLGMGMLLALEFGLGGLALALRSGPPPSRRHSLVLALPILFASLLVPALRSRGALFALPTALLCAALFANTLRPTGRLRAFAAWSLSALGLGLLAHFAGRGDYGHVLELLFAKLKYLGQFPDDPGCLSFETRLLWQGPFASLSPARLWAGLGWLLPLTVYALARALAPTKELAGMRPFALLGALSLALAMGVARLLSIPAMIASAALGPWLAKKQCLPIAAPLLLCGLQAVFFANWAEHLELSWYRPLLRQQELEQMCSAIEEHVPQGQAILTDFINSSAILVHSAHPMVLQAKWETAEAREGVRLFWDAFYHGSPESLRRLARERFRCEWLLVDRYTLGILHASRALAGLRPGESWREGSPAALMLSQDEHELDSIEGYRLIWRSSDLLRQSNGAPSDFFRLFHIEE